MPPFTMSAGDLSVTIAPEIGAGIADFSLAGPLGWRYPLLRRAPAEPSGPGELGCFLLTPWCNRIRGASFRFRGREHRLRPNWPDGTAIHGVGWRRAWSITDRSPVHARLEYDSRGDRDVNFPFPFRSAVRYELFPDRLAIELDVENVGPEAMPAGLGLHPYFPRTLWTHEDAVELSVPNRGEFPARGCLPTGPAEATPSSVQFARGSALGSPGVDSAYEGLSGPIEVRWPASGVALRMESSEACGKAVVFTPEAAPGRPLAWFCAEPVTMLNDGFNLLEEGWTNTGVRALEPGERLAMRTVMVVTRT